MPETDSDRIVARLLELERELAKAKRYRDKWNSQCEDLERDIDAFRRVARQMGIDVDSVKETAQPSTGHVAKIVREAVGEIELEDFTVKDVKKLRREELASVPTSSVSRVLIRMEREGDLDLVRRGKGARPSRYRRPEVEDEAGTDDDEIGDVRPFPRAEGGG